MPKYFDNFIARSFVHLNDLHILNRSYVIDISQVIITPLSGILIGVWYPATSLNDPMIFICCKNVYEEQQVIDHFE